MTLNNTDRLGSSQDDSTPTAQGHEADNLDLVAIERIRKVLNEFYPDVRKAILEYCLFITEKDMEA
jgi:hypothetical protein